jgi:hypothetical protein
MEIIELQKLIEVDIQQVKGQTHVIPKDKVRCHMDHTLFVLTVVLSNVLKHTNFHLRLAMKPLLVSNDLKCNLAFLLMIKSANDSPKRPLPK